MSKYTIIIFFLFFFAWKSFMGLGAEITETGKEHKTQKYTDLDVLKCSFVFSFSVIPLKNIVVNRYCVS